ncbi:MAG: DEAD/DEAH box helicase family protein [Chitinophagaceae bacterium]|nr:DEAD/DEAH box helicase family protein [Chitinophagaceae bacterium]
MLKETNFKTVYSSGEDEPAEFFLDGLIESNSFDLALGFFSSSGFRALSIGFAYFIKRGGKMRMIINDVLSQQDKDAIEKGLVASPDELIEQNIIDDIVRLEKTLSGFDKHFFNCISWLVATQKLEIMAIVPAHHSQGIVHHKFGIFSDSQGDRVAFNGSANFSNSAMFWNVESLSCYVSWTNEKMENSRLSYFSSLFGKIWSGSYPAVRSVPIDKIKTALIEHFPVQDLDYLLEEERELIGSFETPTSNSFKLKMELLRENLGPSNKPHFPKGKTPHRYQDEACENWFKAGCIGFFEMATGTGKTITSLNCVLTLYQKENRYRVLILVPTLSLADQWLEDCEAFGFTNVILANSRSKDWVAKILQEINKSSFGNHSYCLITTYQTFNMEKFQAVIGRLDTDTIFIADEAHNLGTQRSQSHFPEKFARRIGLSATPERHFDPEGTKAILQFFNATEAPTFQLTMQEAIEQEFLCKYYYYPKIVSLTDEELHEYKEISRKLLKYFNGASGGFQDNPVVTSLLLKRRRIIHKAENKLNTLRICLDELLAQKAELKYTLVYVPEGISSTADEDDERLINEYASVISNEYHLAQHQFIGTTKNRKEILQRFSEGEIAVLTAMKCLDEGVDVKRTEVAIFCASTSNPRQFIQRRGRILRTHPQKKFAYIYDMIVVPDISSRLFDESISMEKSILAAELRRVYEFASMSINKYQALKTLEAIAEQYKIDIFSSEISTYGNQEL